MDGSDAGIDTEDLSATVLRTAARILREGARHEVDLAASGLPWDLRGLPYVRGQGRSPLGEALEALFLSLDQPYDCLVFAGRLAWGASSRMAVDALEALGGGGRGKAGGGALLVVTEAGRAEAPERLPAGASLRVLSAFAPAGGPGLSRQDRAQLVSLLIRMLKPRAIFNAGSQACWDSIANDGTFLATATACHVALFDEDMPRRMALFRSRFPLFRTVSFASEDFARAVIRRCAIPPALHDRLVIWKQPLPASLAMSLLSASETPLLALSPWGEGWVRGPSVPSQRATQPLSAAETGAACAPTAPHPTLSPEGRGLEPVEMSTLLSLSPGEASLEAPGGAPGAAPPSPAVPALPVVSGAKRREAKIRTGRPDITIVITAHAEGLLAGASAQSVLRAKKHAEAAGARVEVLAALDRPDAVTELTFAAWESLGVTTLRVDCGDVGLARNEGVRASSGRWIAFIDADDLWGANWLSAAFARAEDERRAVVWHPEVNVYFGESRSLFLHVDMESEAFSVTALLINNCWTALCFASRSFLLDTPYAPTEWSRQVGYEDWAWNMEAIARGALHKVVPDTGHLIRVKPANQSLRRQTVSCLPRSSDLYRRLIIRRNGRAAPARRFRPGA